ncbi:MAG: hypothetical protein RMA76_22725 [Deltaproteobacteria bacterium]|jgi:hypothetical protein
MGPLAAIAVVTQLAIGLPPPLCEGRVVGRYDPSLDSRPSARAVAEVQAAYDALCPKHNCGKGELFKNHTMGNNAATWVNGIRNGAATRAKIVYSKQFLEALAVRFGDGASFGVLAHEVGHHLTAALNMRAEFEASWNEELRADYLAGCALGRSGRPPDELENALRALASVATKSHPSFAQRNPVVRRGYDECRASAADLRKVRPAFGLGSLAEKPASEGCGYWYRLKEQVDRVGPVAAPRRRAGPFKSIEACRSHERKLSEERTSEGCVCP